MILPSVIIVGGVCGSGKSTIGSKLAERIDYTFVDGDDLHSEESKAKMSSGESLTGSIPSGDADRMPWLARIRGIWTKGGDITTAKGFVIACSALKRKYRSFLLDAQQQSNGKYKVIIMLNVPEQILRQRMAQRNDHFAKSNLIPSQLDDLELPQAEENGGKLCVMTVDGTGETDQIVEEIITKSKNAICRTY